MIETETVVLCTFPTFDKNYCKQFEVLRNWFMTVLEHLGQSNLEKFLDEYTWDETWFIYLQAINDGAIASEMEIK